MRVSPRQTVTANSNIKLWVASDVLDDNQDAWLQFENLRDEASAQSTKGANWDHANANIHLWKMEADQATFTYDDDQPLLVTTVVMAELAVSRSFEYCTFSL